MGVDEIRVWLRFGIVSLVAMLLALSMVLSLTGSLCYLCGYSNSVRVLRKLLDVPTGGELIRKTEPALERVI